MRLAVIDTNVIVSAGMRLNSKPYTLVSDWILRGDVQLVLCPTVMTEYREVLHRPKFRRQGFPPDWLEPLIEMAIYLPDPAGWPVALPDPKDEAFLALAHAAGAWLVTGNLKHFPKSARAGVTVLSPGEYLAHLEEGSRKVEGA